LIVILQSKERQPKSSELRRYFYDAIPCYHYDEIRCCKSGCIFVCRSRGSDILVLRISYQISRKIIDPVILDDCRERAAKYLDSGMANKLRFVAALILVWGFALFLFAK